MDPGIVIPEPHRRTIRAIMSGKLTSDPKQNDKRLHLYNWLHANKWNMPHWQRIFVRMVAAGRTDPTWIVNQIHKWMGPP